MLTRVAIVIAILLAIGAVVVWYAESPVVKTPVPQAQLVGEAQPGASMSIEEYVRQNISALSPVKEQLGGKFYVTQIEAHGGTGTVSYEDGHSAYTADFTYTIDASGTPSVQSFAVRP